MFSSVGVTVPGTRDVVTDWSHVERLLADTTAAGVVPGVVAVVANRDGELFEAASGYRNMVTREAMRVDSVLRVASQAKLPTAILVLRLIEQERLSLDAAVGDVLPAFDDLLVLDGFDGDEPRLRPPASRATIRQLLTHTSGLGYDIWNRSLERYSALTSQPTLATGSKSALTCPMVSDPGTRFNYGTSMDWAGLVVEEIEGQSIDKCFQSQIFGPLGLTATTCWLEGDLRLRSAPVHVRGENGAWLPTQGDYYSLPEGQRPEFYQGVHSLYSTAGDFLRIQQVVLDGGRFPGGQLLRPSTVEAMVTNQIGALDVGIVEAAMPVLSEDVDLVGMKWGLGLLVNPGDEDGLLPAHTAGWAGGMNSFYWIDQAQGITAAIYTQTLPFCAPAVLELLREFQSRVYGAIGSRAPVIEL